jgi:putative transposase
MTFCVDFFAWYSDQHHHGGLAMFTPADVHFSRIDERLAQRQATLDSAYEAHPERFPHGRPTAGRPALEVRINPPTMAPSAPAEAQPVATAEVRS